jgi:serine/threonine protein phosphatase PrpC
MKYLIKAFGNSDIGNVRTNNEDRFLILTTKNQETFFMVADGMGGHSAGEVASGHMVEIFESYLSEKSLLESTWNQKDKENKNFSICNRDFLLQVIQKGNNKIYHQALDESNMKGMGTTLTLGIARENKLTLAQVGDSRAYLIRKGKISRLTKDHSLVQREIDLGTLTEEEALHDPRKNVITKAVGILPEVEPDFYDYTLENKDRIMLCSDGLYDLVMEKELLTICRKGTLSQAVTGLIEKAKQMGGKDNITVIVADVAVEDPQKRSILELFKKKDSKK